MSRSNQAEEGFTLVELLISVIILAIIFGALSMALMAFLRNAYVTSKRATHSAGASILETYLDRDLASASYDSSDTVQVANTTLTCSGATSQMVVQWHDVTNNTASGAIGDPISASLYQSAYAVKSYTGTSEDQGTRTFTLYRVDRCLYRDGTLLSAETLVSDVDGTGGLTATATAPNGSGPCGAPVASDPRLDVVVTLKQFVGDTNVSQKVYSGDKTSAYRYAGCFKGRL